MRLYKMELYKIFYKKITIISAVLIATFMTISFVARVLDEKAVIQGETYTGFKAIEKEREMTKPFEGILTNQKIEQIAEQYGFPSLVIEQRGGWQDGNYLSSFVADYFSDGYMRGWSDYKIATKTITIAESEMGRYLEESGKDLYFAYAKGWKNLFDFLQIGMVLASAWLILALSPLFSEEYQTKTKALLFTTEYGKSKAIAAKIVAAFSVAALAYLCIVALCGILYGAVYGFSGSNMLTAVVTEQIYTLYFLVPSLGKRSIAFSFCIYLITMLGAVFMLTALIIWRSSKARNPFQTVVSMISIWLLPMVIWITLNQVTLRGPFWIRLLLRAQPIFLVIWECIFEAWHRYDFFLWVIGIVTIAGVVFGWSRYKAIDIS